MDFRPPPPPPPPPGSPPPGSPPPPPQRSQSPTPAAAAPAASSPASEESYKPEHTIYGSAYLRDTANVNFAPVFTRPSTAVLMGSDWMNGLTGYLWDLKTAPAHAMTFGPTRKGGKGTSSIIPGLLTYLAGSRLIIDPKAENFWVTAERARRAGHRVVLMDPWNEANRRYGSKVGVVEPVTRFNPLSNIDPKSPDFSDDVTLVADSLIVTQDGPNRHFDDAAAQFVAGCAAAVIEENPGKASLRDVRELITMDDAELLERLTHIVKDNPKSVAARKLRRFTKSNGEVASVRATAETQTAFLDSEALLESMETDAPPFDLAELATGKVSLYLVLPVDKLETHGRWMRLIITLAIRAIARQETPPEFPVLFILDEMGTIGRLTMVENAFGLMAGLGIRLWGFLQDLVQLQGLYPRTWETFISNSSVIQILKAHDPTTSEYVSKYLGNGTVNAKTGGWIYKQVRTGNPVKSLGPGLGTVPTTQWAAKEEWAPEEQLIGRPLMDADEIRRMHDDCCLLLIPGAAPLLQYRTVYYKHPLFKGLYRPNPYFDKSTTTNNSSAGSPLPFQPPPPRG